MLAFHNDASVKEKYLVRVRAHAAADQLIHGAGWENGKGCAVGVGGVGVGGGACGSLDRLPR